MNEMLLNKLRLITAYGDAWSASECTTEGEPTTEDGEVLKFVDAGIELPSAVNQVVDPAERIDALHAALRESSSVNTANFAEMLGDFAANSEYDGAPPEDTLCIFQHELEVLALDTLAALEIVKRMTPPTVRLNNKSYVLTHANASLNCAGGFTSYQTEDGYLLCYAGEPIGMAQEPDTLLAWIDDIQEAPADVLGRYTEVHERITV